METTATGSSQMMMDLLENYIESRAFIGDEHVKSLIDKSIKLGMSWEVVKETLKKFLSAYFHKKNYANIDLYRMDFREALDETRFFDQLVMTSIQMESRSWPDEAEPDDDPEAPTDKKSPAAKHQSFQEYMAASMHRLNDKSNLRPIIVDGSDVALSGQQNKQLFALGRVQTVVEYFDKRQHQIYVIVPQWRKEQIVASSGGHGDQRILADMEQRGLVHYSPSKRVGGKRMYCDDDSFILNLAVIKNAIIVSNDNFKRFLNQCDQFKQVIEQRVLMYSFVDDSFMPAEDPLGKNGPSLSNFLRFESFHNQQYMKRCPYKKKCTYGSKCKFWHPERASSQSGQQFKTAFQSVLDQSSEQRMKLEIILNQPDESSLAAQLISLKAPVFQSRVDKDASLLRLMGPAAHDKPRTTYSLFPQHQTPAAPTSTTANTSAASLAPSPLAAKLKDILGDQHKVDQFLDKYKNEHDEEKLLFLANGYSFDF